jgi:hypothetical protein
MVSDLMYGFDGASFAIILRILFFFLSASVMWGGGGRSIIILSKKGLLGKALILLVDYGKKT